MGARRILSNALLRTVADLGGKVASIVLYAVMGRRLGDEGFGIFAFGLSFVTLVTTFASFGYKTVLTREVSRDRERVHDFVGDTLALQLALSLPVLALVVAGGPLGGLDGDARLVVALLGIAVVAEALMATLFAVAQAFERLGMLPVVLITQRWLTAGGGVAALLAGADVVAVAAIYLAGALLALGLAWVLLRRWVVRPRMSARPQRWRALFVAALPIGAAGLFATIMFRVDMTLLAVFDTDAAVGQYGAAYRLFESTLFIAWAIGAATYPVFSRRGRGGGDDLRPVVEGACKLALAAGLPVAVGAALLAGPVIEAVYGPGYGDGADALVLLAPAIAVYPVAYVGEYVLLSQDRQGTLLRIYAVLAVLTVAAGMWLVRDFGLRGAAVLTSAVETLALIALIAVSWRLCGGLGIGRSTTGPVLATAAMAAAILPLRGTLALATPAGAAAYLSVLVLWERWRHPEDAALVLAAVRRRTA